MKKLAIVIFLLFILTGCNSAEGQSNVDFLYNSTSAQTTVSESINIR
ncbi:MAG TPA: lipoprotein [Clostridium sp.]|nr:lipoprotein [Clostridium sp.]